MSLDFALWERTAAEWTEKLVKDPLVLDGVGQMMKQMLSAKRMWEEAFGMMPWNQADDLRATLHDLAQRVEQLSKKVEKEPA